MGLRHLDIDGEGFVGDWCALDHEGWFVFGGDGDVLQDWFEAFEFEVSLCIGFDGFGATAYDWFGF